MASRILVVDDQRTNAEMVSGLLRNLGYDEQQDVELRLPYNTPLLPSDVGSPDKTA